MVDDETEEGEGFEAVIDLREGPQGDNQVVMSRIDLKAPVFAPARAIARALGEVLTTMGNAPDTERGNVILGVLMFIKSFEQGCQPIVVDDFKALFKASDRCLVGLARTIKHYAPVIDTSKAH